VKQLKFIKIPKTGSSFFELNFCGEGYTKMFKGVSQNDITDYKKIKYQNEDAVITSVTHAWNYPTKIRGYESWINYRNINSNDWVDVRTFVIEEDDILVSIVRNPFDMLYSMYSFDWAKGKSIHGLGNPYSSTIDKFQEYVDIYLKDDNYHIPAFKESLFSQLKDVNGNWLIDENSIIFRFENLNEELEQFSKEINVPITNKSKTAINKTNSKPPLPWFQAYRHDQVESLTKLWSEDLKKFNYAFKK